MSNDQEDPNGTLYTSHAYDRGLQCLIRELVKELIEARGLAWRLLIRNINAMYRQTWLGYFWAIIPSIVTTVVFIFLKSQRVFQVEVDGFSYTIYVITGIILWQTFVESINSPLRMLNQSVSFISRINFPRQALIMAGFGEVIFNSLIRGMVLLVVYLMFGVELSIYTCFALVCFLSLVALGFAIGILIAPIGMLFKDVEKGLVAITTIWFFLTPVFYMVPEGISAGYFYLNPVTPILITVREILMGVPLTQFWLYLIYSLISVILLIPGLLIYKLSLPYIIERLEA